MRLLRILPVAGLLALALPAAASAASCLAEVGRRQAATLVEQCREVSPATRPPCNAANSCALIRGEIRRGCGMLGSDAPEFCAAGGDDDEDE